MIVSGRSTDADSSRHGMVALWAPLAGVFGVLRPRGASRFQRGSRETLLAAGVTQALGGSSARPT